MAKLIYFYVSDGARSENVKISWNPSNISTNRYAISIANEGMFQLWSALAEQKVVEHVCVFIDSMRGAHGHINVTPYSTVYSIPHLSDALPFINREDIIVARGGFKPWYETLKILQERGNWILFYRANTNRHPWPFWDVILDDLIPAPVVHANRLHFNFSKPVNEKLFYPLFDRERKYDVMLNASHIHVKKGQHRFIRAAIEYKKLFKKDIAICLPGGFIRSWAQKEILDNIKEYKLNVHMPGGVPRESLNLLMNESKIYVHIGTGGQNDRGCLEAMRCGLPVLISNCKAFAPFVYSDTEYASIVHPDADPIFVAQIAHDALEYYELRENVHEKTMKYYILQNGLHNVALTKVRRLVENLFDIRNPDRGEIIRRYCD